MLGGAVWAILGLSAMIGYLQAIPGREDVLLFVVALLLTATGLIALHRLQKDSYGSLGRAGFYITLAAIVARILGALVFLAGSSALEWISPPATAVMLVGFVLYISPPCEPECCRAGTAWLSSLPCPFRYPWRATELRCSG